MSLLPIMSPPSKGPAKNAKAAGASPKKPRKCGGVTLAVDLKVDSPKIREMEKKVARRKGFKWAMTGIIVICLVVLVKITVSETFLKNPQFSLQRIVVRTHGPLTTQKIVRATALTQGTNLLTINMRDLHARITQLPQVKTAKIIRDYKGGLTLEITQRQPLAWIECAKHGMVAGRIEEGHFLDAEGAPFPCEVLTDAYLALPVIRHEGLSQNTPGVPIPDLQIKSALRLLAELHQRFEQGPEEPRVIDIQTPYSLVVTFADRAQITFGVDDLDLQFERLDRVRLEARHRKWHIETLNLLARQNVPVTFRQPPDLSGLLDPPPVPAPVTMPSPRGNEPPTR